MPEQTPPNSPPSSLQTSLMNTPHDESLHDLQQAIHDSEELIVQRHTVFPFSMFPDTLAVDRAKITITKRDFFRVAETVSFRVEDTLNAACVVGPFLGHVKMVGRVLSEQQEVEIGPFWREDAAMLKRVIQGYIIAIQKGIDTTNLSTKELRTVLERLGQDSHGIGDCADKTKDPSRRGVF